MASRTLQAAHWLLHIFCPSGFWFASNCAVELYQSRCVYFWMFRIIIPWIHHYCIVSGAAPTLTGSTEAIDYTVNQLQRTKSAVRESKMLLTLLRLTFLACAAASTDIHFGFVATDNSAAIELMAPLEIALDLINNSSSILPGYQLNFVPWLSEVNYTLIWQFAINRGLV